jgi:hypothetical protein
MRFPALIAVPAIALALAGCSAQEPATQPTTSSVVKPLFSSDEEALAAAEAAYVNYLQVSDQIARDGGANPERLKGLVSTELYLEQKPAYVELEASGLHAGGVTTMDNFRIQDFSESGSKAYLTAYLCLDVSKNPVLNSLNQDVTPIGRESRIPLNVTFSFDGREIISVDASEVWTGTNFC